MTPLISLVAVNTPNTTHNDDRGTYVEGSGFGSTITLSYTMTIYILGLWPKLVTTVCFDELWVIIDLQISMGLCNTLLNSIDGELYNFPLQLFLKTNRGDLKGS